MGENNNNKKINCLFNYLQNTQKQFLDDFLNNSLNNSNNFENLELNSSNSQTKFLDKFIKKAERYTIMIIYTIFNGKGKWDTPNDYNTKRFFFFFKKLEQIWKTPVNINIDFLNERMKRETGGGEFLIHINTIALYTPCLLIALHEWKHKLQQTYPFYTINTDMEIDAISWSHTIFKLVFPDIYRQKLLNGQLFNVPKYLFPLKIFNTSTPLLNDKTSDAILQKTYSVETVSTDFFTDSSKNPKNKKNKKEVK